MTRIFGTLMPNAQNNTWEHAFPGKLRAAVEASSENYRYADRVEDADIVVVFESNIYKDTRYIATVAQSEFVRQHGEKLFTINYEDNPHGLLPGLYASLRAKYFDSGRHCAATYFDPPNDSVNSREPSFQRGKLLFSFRGSISHPCRLDLLKIPESPRWAITKIDKWYDHTKSEKQTYAEEIDASQFVLCPRGIGTSSFRIFETMALGKCPVLISDEWVEPECIDWQSCSVRIPESEIASIPDVLSAREGEAQELGRNAYRVWKDHFSPEKRVDHYLDRMIALRERRPTGYSETKAIQSGPGFGFLYKRGLTIPQRALHKLRRKFSA